MTLNSAYRDNEACFSHRGHVVRLCTFGRGDHISNQIFESGFYEIDLLERVAESYLPGTAIVDLGARIGNHTIFFGKILGARVYAVEPFGSAFRLLKLNVEQNGISETVKLFHCAINRNPGRGKISVGPSTNTGQTRVIPDDHGEVEILPLENVYISEPIGVVKIDVEGGELDALGGMRSILSEQMPDVFVEVIGTGRFHEILAYFHELGYVPVARFGWTPTYLFSVYDQRARIGRIVRELGVSNGGSPRLPRAASEEVAVGWQEQRLT